MKLLVTTLLLFLVLVAHTQSQTTGIQLEERNFLENKLSLLLPKEFALMGEEMLKLKYPSQRRPTLVYTNKDGTVDVAFNHTQDRVTLNQLPDLHKTVQSLFRNLYPTATWFRDELSEVNGRKCFLLDLRTPAIDTEVRNLILGTSLDGRLLIVTFNSHREHESTWLQVGNKIIQSVRVKE